ncbi:MAG: hypothetical protein BMS9Abin36_1744 [Gammaproteobacteria bacterium]|nr:MAG: hypothetical protein BMS9Abin36_1744 [Gammaproteobacteria bacterium]
MNTHGKNVRHWRLLYLLVVPAVASAQPISLSPDITLQLGSEIVADEGVVVDDQAGGIVPADVGTLPDGADLTAYYRFPAGDRLMAFDTTLTLGGITLRRGDVARFDGSNYTLEFDARAQGVPPGAWVDALASDGTDLFLSFNTTVLLSGETFDDADLVQVMPTGFVRYFDSALAGVPIAMDLDAADVAANGVVYVSFDTGGTLGGVDFADEDMLRYDPGTTGWALEYDGDALHADWSAADLDALSLVGDSDNDGILDTADNCILHSNPDQRDTNADGFGNRCDPDLNNDLKIDFADLAELKSVFFTTDADADLNGDSRVDFADLAIQKQMFFGPPGPSSQAP